MENVEREKMGSQDNWGFFGTHLWSAGFQGTFYNARQCSAHCRATVSRSIWEPPCLLPVAEVDYLNTLINRNHKSDVAI